MAAKRPYSNRKYMTYAKKLKQPGVRCHLCGQVIDIELPYTHKMSFTLDHLTPLKHGGDAYNPSNLRPAHRACNSSKQARAYSPNIIKRSGSA